MCSSDLSKRQSVENGANPRDVKFEFATEIVTRFHGQLAARNAATGFDARFRDGLLPENMPEVTLHAPAAGMVITQVLKQADLAPSVTEANRLIGQGGVKVEGDKVLERSLMLAKGKTYVVQVGKRKVARITLT